MLQRCRYGLVVGALYGLVYGSVAAAVTFIGLQLSLGRPLQPLTSTTGVMLGLAISVGAILGLFAEAIGRIVTMTAYRRLNVVLVGMLLLIPLLSPLRQAIHGFLILFAGALTHLLMYLARRHPARAGLALMVLLAVCAGALTRQSYLERVPAVSPDRPRPTTGAPNVLWFVFDTVRADHLSLYGYPRPTSPHLDQVAKEGTHFTRAYATASWTLPSHASMLTGLYVHQHRTDYGSPHLNEQIPTLPELLHDAGYDTALFTGNPWLDAHSGLSRGFAHVVPSWQRAMIENAFLMHLLRNRLLGRVPDKGATVTNEALKRWLEVREADERPFFAFVNYLEAHMPYLQIPAEDRVRFLPPGATLEDASAASERLSAHLPSAQLTDMLLKRVMTPLNRLLGRPRANDGGESRPGDDDRALGEALYDGGIASVDRRFGEIIELLRRMGRLNNTLVIVTADHGELFGEHGVYGHDAGLYHPLMHVPLVLRLPGRAPAGTRITAPVQLVDLFPTVLELAGLSDRVPAHVHGRSLWSVFAGGAPLERPVFGEQSRPTLPWAKETVRRRGFEPETYALRSVQVGGLRFIEGPANLEHLFDLATDPGETTNVVAQRPEEARALRTLLEQFARTGASTETIQKRDPVEMDAATREQLRALGYLQ